MRSAWASDSARLRSEWDFGLAHRLFDALVEGLRYLDGVFVLHSAFAEMVQELNCGDAHLDLGGVWFWVGGMFRGDCILIWLFFWNWGEFFLGGEVCQAALGNDRVGGAWGRPEVGGCFQIN